MKECANCGFLNDNGCECPHADKWYACPIENKKPENIEALEQKSCTVKDSENYEALWIRLYNWLNDMRFSIAPDETVIDYERKIRSIQVDLLDEIMEWMVDQVPKADGGGE